MSWDAKARRVRNVQQQLDAKLAAYSQFASETAAVKSPLSSSPSIALDMSGGNATAASNQAALESEIQSLLKQYADAQAEQATLLNDPTFPPTPTQLHAIQRHRELLMEIEREFFQTRTQFQHAISRQQLLGNVREDIHAYRTQYTSETQAYLDERERLERSQRVMDETLDQAFSTQEAFRAQRAQLRNTLNRMAHTAAQIPGLNNVISMITRRRRRDSTILAAIVAVCIVFLVWFGTRS